jgi:hypothetical protein
LAAEIAEISAANSGNPLSATPAGLRAFLTHLFAYRLAHLLIDPFRRERLPMTLSWCIDRSA